MELNSEAAVETDRPQNRPQITDGENEGERQRARRASVRLTRRGPMGEGATRFRLTLERAKLGSGLIGSYPCWPSVHDTQPRHGTSHRTVLAQTRLQPYRAQTLRAVPCSGLVRLARLYWPSILYTLQDRPWLIFYCQEGAHSEV